MPPGRPQGPGRGITIKVVLPHDVHNETLVRLRGRTMSQYVREAIIQRLRRELRREKTETSE